MIFGRKKCTRLDEVGAKASVEDKRGFRKMSHSRTIAYPCEVEFAKWGRESSIGNAVGGIPFHEKKKKRKKNALKLALSSLTFRVASDAASKIHATRILMQRGAISTRGNL